MRSRVIPGSSVTMERRCPMIRLNTVDLPTLGRPTMAIRGRGECMRGSGGNFGLRISDFGFEGSSPNPNSEIPNPKWRSLPFYKISHQIIWHLGSVGGHLWDLRCHLVSYSKITTIRSLKTQRSGTLEAASRRGRFPIFFLAPAIWGNRQMSV